MATHLRKLNITELSLVDSPANAGAVVSLIKRNADSSTETEPRELTLADYATAFVLQGASAEEAVALAKRAYSRDQRGRFSGVGSRGAGGVRGRGLSSYMQTSKPNTPSARVGAKTDPWKRKKDVLLQIKYRARHASSRMRDKQKIVDYHDRNGRPEAAMKVQRAVIHFKDAAKTYRSAAKLATTWASGGKINAGQMREYMSSARKLMRMGENAGSDR